MLLHCKMLTIVITKIIVVMNAGTVVGQVEATDADGLHNTVTYSLGNVTDYFSIDSANGSIKTLQMLNYSQVHTV